MTSAEIAQAVLGAALAADAHPFSLTIRPRRLSLLVRDHRVSVEVRGGVLRAVWVAPPVGGGRATRDVQLMLDDADAALLGEIVAAALREGLTPF